MEITILAFGNIADLTGKSSWKITCGNNTKDLLQTLHGEFPELHKVKYVLAINKKLILMNTLLNDGDTVALLPPFSGG